MRAQKLDNQKKNLSRRPVIAQKLVVKGKRILWDAEWKFVHLLDQSFSKLFSIGVCRKYTWRNEVMKGGRGSIYDQWKTPSSSVFRCDFQKLRISRTVHWSRYNEEWWDRKFKKRWMMITRTGENLHQQTDHGLRKWNRILRCIMYKGPGERLRSEGNEVKWEKSESWRGIWSWQLCRWVALYGRWFTMNE